MTTVGDLLRTGTATLRASGSETPRLDAELLLAHAIGIDRTGVLAHPSAPVGTDAERAFGAAIDRRSSGEPVAYIRGVKEFYGLAFAVDRRALIPRPETELLVELAEQEIVGRLTRNPRPVGSPRIQVIDVGTGTGAIAVALAVLLRRRRMSAEVDITAADRSADAVSLAKENAVGHSVADRLRFLHIDLFPADGTQFDLVVANLPYIPTGQIERLPVAASFEPREALDGGLDGLRPIGLLIEQLPEVTMPSGTALIEIGADHAEAVRGLAASGLEGWSAGMFDDLSGLPRVIRLDAPAE